MDLRLAISTDENQAKPEGHNYPRKLGWKAVVPVPPLL
jgi:hypothetical protein